MQQQCKSFKSKLQQTEKSIEDRASEQQNKLVMLTDKLQSLESERIAERRELQELQEKFAIQTR